MRRIYKKFNIALMLVLTLNIFMNVLLSAEVAYAGPTEDLRARGFIEMYNDFSATLKAGKTYYIALRGGDGGDGSAGQFESGEVTGSGGQGYLGSISYYKVVVDNDTLVKFHKGENGEDGFNILENHSNSYGGNGGRNSYGQGYGSEGEGSNNSDKVYGGSLGIAGAGGGGGGASIMTFLGNNTYRIVANGGEGGKGGSLIAGSFSGGRAYGGWGGKGGTLSQNFSNIPGVTVTQVSNFEGAARVKTPASSGVAIKELRDVRGGESLKVSDIQVGEKIVLSNSIDGSLTMFEKTEKPYEFKYLDGATEFTSETGKSLFRWYAFSKYAVSGMNYGKDMLIVVKQDLTFVGGEGNAIFPYYPEEAGSIDKSAGGKGMTLEDIELLSNSILSVAKQLEDSLNYEKKFNDENQEKSKAAYIPFSINAKSVNNLTVTKNSSIAIVINVNGRESSTVKYNITVNGAFNDTWTKLPQNNIVTVTGLSNGYNTILVSIRDENSDTQTDVISIWRIK